MNYNLNECKVIENNFFKIVYLLISVVLLIKVNYNFWIGCV